MKNIHYTIRQKIYILITLTCLFPLLIVTVYSLNKFSHQVQDTTLSSMTQICQSVSYNMENTLGDIKDASNTLLSTDEIQTGIETGTLGRWELSKNIINMTTNKKFIASTVIMLPDNTVYSRTNSSAATYGELYANAKMEDFENFIFNNSDTNDPSIWNVWMDGENFYIPDNSCIFFSRSINSLTSLQKYGCMIIGVDKNLFSVICNNELKEADFAIYIVSDKQVIFSTTTDNDLEKHIKEHSSLDRQDKYIDIPGYLVCQTINPTTNWQVYCTLPVEYLSHSKHNVIFFTLLLGFFSLVCSLFAAYIITFRITKQIYLLTNAIDKLEQQEFTDLNFDLRDEIGWLGNRFQIIVAENHRLTTSLYETTLKQKEAELMMMQSQINPHFLYNTLNNLYWMTKKAHANEAAKMALNLSRFFELALNHGNPVTTIARELSLVRCYFEIQNLRFNNRFELMIDVPENVLNYEIPNILLQPLVENSIVHGLEMLETKGMIKISALSENDFLIISVEDNGIGFPSDYKLMQSDGYALKNIDERLKLTYGKNSGLQIENTSPFKTVVSIYIPKV